jgi:hypothetical protein
LFRALGSVDSPLRAKPKEIPQKDFQSQQEKESRPMKTLDDLEKTLEEGKIDRRRTVEVTFADGSTLCTEINGTVDSISNYYLGKYFNFGDTEEHPSDKMIKATQVKFLS